MYSISIKRIIIYIILFQTIGCISYSILNEMVMSEGMIIEVVRNNQKIKIVAHEKMKRTFSIENEAVTIKMKSRSVRWKGNLGAYCAGGNDKIHTVIEEGQQHFFSANEAIEWLSWLDSRMHYVYTSDGLVLGWEFQCDQKSSKKALNVQIWQFYIKGKKPDKMEDAKDNQIKVYFKQGYQSDLPEIGKFNPSSPETINGYLYSGKSIDLMKERKKSSKDIEKLIKYGEIEKGEGGGITYYSTGEEFDSFNDLYWVKLDKNQRVILFD